MNNIKTFVVNNAPSIFTGLAMVGVVGTAYLAYKSFGNIESDKAIDTELTINQAGEKPVYSIVEPQGKDLAIIYAKNLWPTVVVGSATIYCIFAANRINLRRETMLISTLASAYEYREEVKRVIGEKKEQKIYDGVQKKKAMNDILDTELPPFDNDDGKVWCYEPVSKQFFKTSKERLLWAEMNLNKKLNGAEWGICFNEFLDCLGCPPKKECDKLGWWSTDIQGFWDYNWSYFAAGGNPWVTIRQELINVDGQDIVELVYDVNPDINPDSVNMEEAEEPEQYEVKSKKKGVVIKH